MASNTGPIGPSNIESITFYVLGDEDNVRASNVSVQSKTLFSEGIPVDKGIYDAHMGTTDYGWKCQTCMNDKVLCPGHFGDIRLNYPVQSPMYREEILKWLKVTCFNCGE